MSAIVLVVEAAKVLELHSMSENDRIRCTYLKWYSVY